MGQKLFAEQFEYDTKLETLRAEVEGLSGMRDELPRERYKFESYVKGNELERNALDLEMNSLKEAFDVYAKQKDTEIQLLGFELQASQIALKKLQKELDDTVLQHLTQLTTMKEEISKNNASVEKQIRNEFRMELESSKVATNILQDQFSAVYAENSHLKDSLQTIQCENSKLEEDRNQALRKHNEAQIMQVSLRDQLSSLGQVMAQQESDMRHEIGVLGKQYDDTNGQIMDLHKQSASQQHAIHSLEDQLVAALDSARVSGSLAGETRLKYADLEQVHENLLLEHEAALYRLSQFGTLVSGFEKEAHHLISESNQVNFNHKGKQLNR